MTASYEFKLIYGTQTIGRIFNAFDDDGSWFGVFEPTLNPADTELHQRLLDYIAFSEEWNERARSGAGADAPEFNRHDEIITSGLWAIETTNGETEKILEAPVFFYGGEVSWRVQNS